MPRGGHFGALEEPKLIADDIRKFVTTVLEMEVAKEKEKSKV